MGSFKAPLFFLEKTLSTFAAIDIGSNAIRAVIADVKNQNEFVITKKFREPLRLGEDVFGQGAIGPAKIKQAEDLFKKLSDIFQKNKVDKVKAVATSAMRDAKNGNEVKNLIQKQTGINIELIDGDSEAKLIHEAVKLELDLKNKLAVVVDIGGGSTEFTISKNSKLINCRSFNMGAVRLLDHQDLFSLSNAISLQMIEMRAYLDEHIKGQKVDILIGTGGNFRRLGKIKKKITEKGSEEYATLSDIHKVFNELNGLSHKERVKRFEMSDDRADVIIPAVFLIGHIVYMLKTEGIHLPNVGLKEGILLSML
jgi:exopolyphosphatase/guanosine-5'-triphosphate,3'-diphosphate pyrophosphatase